MILKSANGENFRQFLYKIEPNIRQQERINKKNYQNPYMWIALSSQMIVTS